jgi:hypothetical protein
MPLDLLTRNGKPRVNLDLIFPPFLEKSLAVLADCRAQGRDYFLIADVLGNDGGGFRSWDVQDRLFEQGRTRTHDAAGNILRIVTDARGGYSAHNFGIAFDVCADKDMTRPGLQPEWGDDAYDLLGRVVEAHGLVWGGKFTRKDRPHFQWPGYVTGRELEFLRRAVAPVRALKGPPLVQLKAAWGEIYRDTAG